MSVTASGTTPFIYRWYKNGGAISGATAASYAISSVKTSDAGTYYAVVSNVAGSSTSDQAVLTVLSGPVFTLQPASVTVVSGASAKFTASASGSPTPTYQWRKNGVAISGATGTSYTISATTTASAGTYSVVATNSGGSTTSAGAALTVYVPPRIITQPVSVSVLVGSAALFAVTASGTPTPTFQWLKNGAAITGATAASYKIAIASSTNAGTYSVVVRNAAGSVTSNGATLSITSLTTTKTVQALSASLAGPLLPAAPSTQTTLASPTKTPAQKINLSSATMLSPVFFQPQTPQDSAGSGWRVTRWIDRDGGTDIVWENEASGEAELWIMNDFGPMDVIPLTRDALRAATER